VRDLRSNTVRGFLAEWLVMRAVGATEVLPDWHAFDVLTPGGVKVEVKSSAYLQSWSQERHSRIVFSGLMARTWDPATAFAGERTFNSDVYVFCVQTAQEHEDYDPLDVGQWDFYVLPAATVKGIGQRSVGLARVQRETVRVGFHALAQAIDQAAQRQNS